VIAVLKVGPCLPENMSLLHYKGKSVLFVETSNIPSDERRVEPYNNFSGGNVLLFAVETRDYNYSPQPWQGLTFTQSMTKPLK
jgi:hypothetical protein